MSWFGMHKLVQVPTSRVGVQDCDRQSKGKKGDASTENKGEKKMAVPWDYETKPQDGTQYHNHPNVWDEKNLIMSDTGVVYMHQNPFRIHKVSCV
ncbi:hypothetical protein PoB_005167300 [Plakobranchus ocellatus]|uniref:Uncharacterized protein n=1 Tax=Plakobranchus ocellatus TaxID=259542 RepID=A0AAV4C2E9_9GAST|nr:hypothetical protein PoB_005167300 [Plakobranchus ocellatus]